MDYSLRELECFLAVAEELSFTRAARRLHLAQPPLSRHIRELETRIGARLFERGPRMVALTAAGRLFYEETRAVPSLLARAADLARRAGEGEIEQLRLGFVSAVLGPEIAGVLRRFRDAAPAVHVLLHDLPPAEQLRLITEGRLDGGFVGLQPAAPPPGIRFEPWRSERLLAIVSRDHRLAGRTWVRPGDLREERFVAVSSEAAPDFASHVRGLFRQAGFRPRIVLEAPRAQAVAVMAAAGSGVAVLPESAAGFVGDSAVGIALRGVPPITHVVAVGAGRSSQTVETLLQASRAR